MYGIHAKSQMDLVKAYQTACTIKKLDKEAKIQLKTNLKPAKEQAKVFDVISDKKEYDSEVECGCAVFKIAKTIKVHTGEPHKNYQDIAKEFHAISFHVPFDWLKAYHNAIISKSGAIRPMTINQINQRV